MTHPWQLSIEAEESGVYNKLRENIDAVIDDKDTLVNVVKKEYLYSIDDTVDQELEAFLASDFVQQLAVSSLLYLKRVLNTSEDSYWSYGRRRTNDGLYAAEVAVETMPHSDVDTYVLSGLLGYDLARVSKKLEKQAEKLNKSPLERLILLGGLALVNYDEPIRPTYLVYESASVDGISPYTKVGATLHGDFYTALGKKFIKDAIDPTGISRPFAPSLPEKGIVAYHSSEPGILGAILLHQVNRGDAIDLRDFYHKIHQRLQKMPAISGGGPFADYGYDDGEYYARRLENEIEEKPVNMELGILDSFVMMAGVQNLSMDLVSTAQGIDFCRRSGADTETIFTLPNSEIEDYIVALCSSNFGRTSPSALYRVLSVINR